MSVPSSTASSLGLTDLPVVNQTLEPAWVRNGSATTQKAYQTALAFEQMLVEQLSQSLTASSGLGGEEGESSEGGSSGASPASGPISSMLPQALTSGVMNDGGLGLAAQMTRELQSATGAVPAGTGGSQGVAANGGTTVNVHTAVPTTGTPSTVGDIIANGGTSS